MPNAAATAKPNVINTPEYDPNEMILKMGKVCKKEITGTLANLINANEDSNRKKIGVNLSRLFLFLR